MWWANIVNALKTAAIAVSGWLVKTGAATAIKQIVLSGLIEIAREVVAEIAADPSMVSNEEKRKAAINRIKDKLLKSGKTAKDSLINLALELALQELKIK